MYNYAKTDWFGNNNNQPSKGSLRPADYCKCSGVLKLCLPTGVFYDITQGTVSFLTMQVLTTSVTTHVEYSVDNEKICSISGTKTVAQVTGVSAGSTTVRAKLVASSTGVVQAESEMLVYVKEAAVNTVYITSSNTIFTVNKGKSQTLSATLTGNGITNSDQYNLKWTTSDSDIVQVTGISSDYYDLIWSAETVNGSEIVRPIYLETRNSACTSR